jgi:hypothetical protein
MLTEQLKGAGFKVKPLIFSIRIRSYKAYGDSLVNASVRSLDDRNLDLASGVIKRELISNYIDASAVKAQAKGASRVEIVDVASAFETSSDPEEIASMYMASYSS